VYDSDPAPLPRVATNKAPGLLFSDAASVLFLAVLIAVIAAGTMFPPLSPDIYHSWIFLLPLTLFGMNMFARATKQTASLPGLLVIGGAALLMFGAVYGRLAGMEGVLPISIGDVKNVVYAKEGGYRLPFSVCLDDFSVEQEGGSISGFESTFHLRSGDTVMCRGVTRVNRPFRFVGYVFYQQAYDPERPGWTGLKVVRDPGSKFIFLGLLLLNAGILSCIVLHVQRAKKREREDA
jgi:cytochrome c biogenesis protein ResB